MNHEKPWDIKRKDPWNSTIGADTYPGWGVQFVFNGALFTPEEMGNYTYGYIGAAMGLTIGELYSGSWVAAGMPQKGAALENEYKDWYAITNGFNAYKRR